MSVWAVWWRPWRRCRAVREPRRPATADRPAEPHGRCELARHCRSTAHALRHPGWGTVRWSTDWTDDGTGLRPLAGEDWAAVTAEVDRRAAAEVERLVPWLRPPPEANPDPAALARAQAWAKAQAGMPYYPFGITPWTGAAPCCECRYRPCPHHPDESASQTTLPTAKGEIADAVRRGQWPLA